MRTFIEYNKNIQVIVNTDDLQEIIKYSQLWLIRHQVNSPLQLIRRNGLSRTRHTSFTSYVKMYS